IFGRERELEASDARTEQHIMARTTGIISDLATTTAFAELVEDVFWLCSEGKVDLPSFKRREVAGRLSQVTKALDDWWANPGKVLDRLKVAVHYPFKVGRSSWDGWPFLLAIKRYIVE